MNTTCEVYLWGTRVGIIHQDLTKPFASFEYDGDFLKSGIEISPITMPHGTKIPMKSAPDSLIWEKALIIG